MRSTYTIVQDTREKKPLIFPQFMPTLDGLPTKRRQTTIRLKRVIEKLETADYHLRGFEDCVVIERKGSLDEISRNVLSRAGRSLFVAELERLKVCCRWPWLLFEGGPSHLARPTKHNPDPYLATDALLELLLAYNVPLLMLPSDSVGQRQRVGELAARLMVRGAILKEK